MGQIGTINTSGAAGYIGDLAATAMIGLEEVIDTITQRQPTGKTLELRYLIGLAKLVAFEVQGITPLPDFTLAVPAAKVNSTVPDINVSDFTELPCAPWQWPCESADRI